MSRWPERTMAERFWAKVQKTDTCWFWMAHIDAKGYGKFQLSTAKSARAHRVALLLSGRDPAGRVVDHLCRNPQCVNPAHLELVTAAENTARGVRAQQTHCRRGHALTGDNVKRHSKTGSRVCVACAREYGREWARQKRAV